MWHLYEHWVYCERIYMQASTGASVCHQQECCQSLRCAKLVPPHGGLLSLLQSLDYLT